MKDFLDHLRAGGVVGLPTETVYGLSADARSDEAVAKIFALKGRPSTNPLIVHVASVEIAARYVIVDERARALFARFAPGPLTIVLKKRGSMTKEMKAQGSPSLCLGASETIARSVSAGLDTLGIRIPNHPLALELLRAFDGPLAAPSANKSNHVSPTTAAHVRNEFGDAVPVLDGGPCQVGIESTVLSLASDRPAILRPGSVAREQIEAVIGPVAMFSGHVDSSVAASSPGQLAKHYAPMVPAFRCDRATILSLRSQPDHTTIADSAWLVLRDVGEPTDRVIALTDDPSTAARSFYSALRTLERSNPSRIIIEMPPDTPEWAALRDRISRATLPFASGDEAVVEEIAPKGDTAG